MGNAVDAGAKKGEILQKLKFLGALQRTTGDAAKYGPRNFTYVTILCCNCTAPFSSTLVCSNNHALLPCCLLTNK